GIAKALAARDTDRSRNGEDSHDSRMGARRQTPPAHECTYPDFMKCQPLNFKGMEGVFSNFTLIGSSLTWWNSYVMTIGYDVAYAMTWADLKKKITDKYCLRVEIKKLEFELSNLKVKGTDMIGVPDMIHESVVASKSKTMQEAIEMATELMDKKIYTFVERQTENKRKQDDNNNQAQQQPLKKQGVAIAYTVGPGERKESPVATNNHQNPTCYECGNQGHYRSDCLQLKNQDHRNQARGTRAHGMVHALEGRETNQDLNDVEDDINA
nr:hypothetical protein [Tanacetum cinerariifolium]